MNTSLQKTLIEGVIAELVQFSVHSRKQAVYYGLSLIAVEDSLRIQR